MKVITKCVNIENEEFVLIKGKKTYKNETFDYYGTIPYAELDAQGRMKKALNGFEICMAETIEQALKRRENEIKTNKAINEFIAKGYSKEEAIMKAFGF